MKIKTSELTGAALDWAVTYAEHGEAAHYVFKHNPGFHHYSTDWSQGGPIIEREGITISKTAHGFWEAYKRPASLRECYQVDATPLIAAMRCYVASKLGDEAEVPEVLRETT